MDWLREGDANTRSFHRKPSSRQRVNAINYLINSEGTRLESEDGIETEVVTYFEDIFRTETRWIDIDRALECISGRVSDQHNTILTAPILKKR